MNMKRILILLLGLFSVAYGQFSPTSAKTKFVNGISIGSKDSTYFTNAGDTIVLYFGRDSAVYARFKGIHRRLAYAGGTDFVPYTGAVTNVNLGNYRLTARSIKTDSIYANSSAGMYLTTNSGSVVAHWGGGGSVEVDFKGFAGYDANRAGSYTARSFTDKNYVDSSAALRVRYTDTAAMLSDYVDLGSSQTIAGLKTFSNDIVVNGYTFGRGANNNSGNLAIGSLTLTATTSGSLPNIAIGNSALRNITTGASNIAIGTNIMTGSTVGSGNTNVGQNSFADVTSGGNNTSLGNIAGRFTAGSASVTSIDNSTYIGANTRPSATAGVTNETALGYLATGNGSNTVTIGNSSVTDNYFSGVLNSTNTGRIIKNTGNVGYQYYNNARGWFLGFDTQNADSVFVLNYDSTYNAEQKNALYVKKDGSVNMPNGNVGIGTITPSYKLDVRGESRVVGNVADGSGITLISSKASVGSLEGRQSDATTYWQIRPFGGPLRFGADLGTDLQFYTNGITNVRMTITSGGDINAPNVYSATVGGTNRDVFVDNTGLIGYVSSFRASKKNITPISNTDWLHKLNPVAFNYRVKDSTGNYTDSAYKELEYGLVAEEVETVNKEMVFYDVDSVGNKKLRGVHYSKLIIPLLAEVKEHKKRIDAQDKVIEALLTRIKALEAKLN